MVIFTKGETFKTQIKADLRAAVMVQFAGPEQHRINATGSGGIFTILADTTTWKTGDYLWEAWATVGEIKTLIARQYFTLRPSAIDFLTVTDIRSAAKKAVENIRAILSGGASLEAKRYKINNRELERHSIPELLQLLSYWEGKLVYEERKEKGVSMLGPRIEFYI